MKILHEQILSEKNSKHNFKAFIWHGIFLSLASNFMDVHTILPSMLIKAGGTAVTLGLLTTIMVGGSGLMQIVFAGFLSNRESKLKFLLAGINIRIISLFLLALLFFSSDSISGTFLILSIFVLISIFSFSGSFANISYVDILGKSISQHKRKLFFSVKQLIGSVGILSSAFLVKLLLKQFEYPDNYAVLFIIAAILLFIASLGFWKIREVITFIEKKRSFTEFIARIPKEITKSSNLKNYLIIVNIIGLIMGFIPFLILYAKANFGLSYRMVGNILIFKISGMFLASFVLYKRSNSFDYKKLLIFSMLLGALLPILAFLFRHNYLLYQSLFLLGGIFIATYKIAQNGILVEISNDGNRATYTGIAGAGSILPTIFPLVAGFLISLWSFHTLFIIVSLSLLASTPFIKALSCK